VHGGQRLASVAESACRCCAESASTKQRMDWSGMADAARVVVVGSANMDLVVRAPRLPLAGETVMGGDLLRVPVSGTKPSSG
jgi:hypothetical protein